MAFLAKSKILTKSTLPLTIPSHLDALNVFNYIQNSLRHSITHPVKRKFQKKNLIRKLGAHIHNVEKSTVLPNSKSIHQTFKEDAYFIFKKNKAVVNECGNFCEDLPLLAKYIDQDGTSLSKPNLLFVSKKRILQNFSLIKQGTQLLTSSAIPDSHKSRCFSLHLKTWFGGIPASRRTSSRYLLHHEEFCLSTSVNTQNHFHTSMFFPNLTCGKKVENKCSNKSKKDNLTAVLYGVNDLKLEQRPIPKPKDDQVLLQMEVIGICGSDVHYLVEGRIGPFIVEKPMVIGHEASGTVVKVGKCVKHLKEGDRVAIEPGVCCRMCNYCKTGRYNLCRDMAFCATPPIDGNLARFYVHAADFCFKLPEHVSLEEGALLEPLSCGVRACKRGNVTIGSTVLILGAGPIGLTSLLAAKAFGASRIVVTDLVEHRLEVAKKLGANCTIQVCPDHTEEDIIDQIKETFNCKEPSVSIECTGAEICIRIAVQAVKAGGSAVLLGMGKTEIKFPLGSAIFKEVDVKGIFRYVNNYPTSLEMVASGKVNVKPLVTHEYKLEETLKAFETAKTGEGNAIKVLIHANPKWKPGAEDSCKE